MQDHRFQEARQHLEGRGIEGIQEGPSRGDHHACAAFCWSLPRPRPTRSLLFLSSVSSTGHAAHLTGEDLPKRSRESWSGQGL